MFRVNEELGCKSTFNKSLPEYTTELKRDNSQYYRDLEAWADKQANEIEKQPTTRMRMDLENDANEDDSRFSDVVRAPYGSQDCRNFSRGGPDRNSPVLGDNYRSNSARSRDDMNAPRSNQNNRSFNRFSARDGPRNPDFVPIAVPQPGPVPQPPVTANITTNAVPANTPPPQPQPASQKPDPPQPKIQSFNQGFNVVRPTQSNDKKNDHESQSDSFAKSSSAQRSFRPPSRKEGDGPGPGSGPVHAKQQKGPPPVVNRSPEANRKAPFIERPGATRSNNNRPPAPNQESARGGVAPAPAGAWAAKSHSPHPEPPKLPEPQKAAAQSPTPVARHSVTSTTSEAEHQKPERVVRTRSTENAREQAPSPRTSTPLNNKSKAVVPPAAETEDQGKDGAKSRLNPDAKEFKPLLQQRPVPSPTPDQTVISHNQSVNMDAGNMAAYQANQNSPLLYQQQYHQSLLPPLMTNPPNNMNYQNFGPAGAMYQNADYSGNIPVPQQNVGPAQMFNPSMMPQMMPQMQAHQAQMGQFQQVYQNVRGQGPPVSVMMLQPPQQQSYGGQSGMQQNDQTAIYNMNANLPFLPTMMGVPTAPSPVGHSHPSGPSPIQTPYGPMLYPHQAPPGAPFQPLNQNTGFLYLPNPGGFSVPMQPSHMQQMMPSQYPFTNMNGGMGMGMNMPGIPMQIQGGPSPHQQQHQQQHQQLHQNLPRQSAGGPLNPMNIRGHNQGGHGGHQH